MTKSAGILLYRFIDRHIEILLVHPGGPFWKNKDSGAWSIPKGEFQEEDPLSAGIREFEEETGIKLSGDFMQLSPVKQKSGKLVYTWALDKDIDAGTIQSNTFEMEWPPGSGKKQACPEVDRAEWFSLDEAKEKIIEAQIAVIDELALKLGDWADK